LRKLFKARERKKGCYVGLEIDVFQAGINLILTQCCESLDYLELIRVFNNVESLEKMKRLFWVSDEKAEVIIK